MINLCMRLEGGEGTVALDRSACNTKKGNVSGSGARAATAFRSAHRLPVRLLPRSLDRSDPCKTLPTTGTIQRNDRPMHQRLPRESEDDEDEKDEDKRNSLQSTQFWWFLSVLASPFVQG
eukprot:TRINITY_DN3112_c0_g1_i2.p1 TRINITY_DN3112_c0_g1~~TRINITY_DN3112_c0_g1_i2.p1  ORF type:complete len:120 (+),score=4.07 TRINITY_DN3112_c0_g1_i2:123-482(+)